MSEASVHLAQKLNFEIGHVDNKMKMVKIGMMSQKNITEVCDKRDAGKSEGRYISLLHLACQNGNIDAVHL